MLRWIGFFLIVLVVHRVLRALPFVGDVLARFGLIGLWLTAIVVGIALGRLGQLALERRRIAGEVRQLENVDSPHNRGKLGSLWLGRGRPRRAIPLLEEAAEGEPESVEWPYLLGRALLEAGKPEEAVEPLSRAVRQAEEHAYGGAMMRLAEAFLATGRVEDALEALERFERNHGESPESAYRRGQALRAAGRKDEARQAFGRVSELAGHVPRYQRAEARSWALRARLAGLF